ncbi:MAG: phosphoglucosamine mutase [Clostridia bacterium]|nr:phosphoglucosamine mutase [Clostridia bacterium]MBR5785890.1 phosphoglucosamine mutase [Clostridia bacterium]
MGRLFGTDGIRGIANSFLSCELAVKVGRAAGTVLSDGSRRRLLFCVGSDTRISSDMLSFSIASGLCSVGVDVIILGVVPTPAVAYLVEKYKADAGIMISASHNPAEYNGIKIFSGDGYKIPDALEEQIETLVLDEEIPENLSGTDIGKVTYANNAVRDYVEHLKSTVMNSLDGLNIAVDCANGSASVSAEMLFKELGANADILHNKPNGININRNCGSTHIELLREYVLSNKLDAGVAYDGDADRCICVDDKGNIVDGDFIMAICAKDMKSRGKLAKNAVVGTVMTNMGFGKFCKENDINFVATKVGDRFVLEEMLQEGYAFGGEQSGHVIFKDFASTGDGQLTSIQLLSLVKRSGQKLSELAEVMKRYPQCIINVTVSKDGKLAYYTDPQIKAAIEEAKKEFGDTGRIVVRPSGTEPLIRVMTEGEDRVLTESIAKRVSEVIQDRLSGK